MIRIGYAPGAFDLFHIGHLNLLRRAKERCDYLVAGVVSDEVLIAHKGVTPVVPLVERIEIVRNCRYVDAAHAAMTDDKLEIWRDLRFNVFFKGDDWQGTERGKFYADGRGCNQCCATGGAILIEERHSALSRAVATFFNRSRNHRCPVSVVCRGCQYILSWMSGNSKGGSSVLICVVWARRLAARSRTRLTSCVPCKRNGTSRKLSTVTSILRLTPILARCWSAKFSWRSVPMP
jgi:cytidyltransferase-like protein